MPVSLLSESEWQALQLRELSRRLEFWCIATRRIIDDFPRADIAQPAPTGLILEIVEKQQLPRSWKGRRQPFEIAFRQLDLGDEP